MSEEAGGKWWEAGEEVDVCYPSSSLAVWPLLFTRQHRLLAPRSVLVSSSSSTFPVESLEKNLLSVLWSSGFGL
ncbi:hypothetical protein PAMP_011711 [Pampus punctatissimus]